MTVLQQGKSFLEPFAVATDTMLDAGSDFYPREV